MDLYEKGRKRKLEWQRFALGGFFIISLALFFHFKQSPPEILKVGSVSPRYIVAQMSFDFPDVQMTSLLQREAMRDIGIIYFIDEQEIKERVFKTKKALSQDFLWRKEVPHTTFKEIDEVIDLIAENLRSVRFTDERTLRKMNEVGVATSMYEIIAGHSFPALLPFSFWNDVTKKLLTSTSVRSEAFNYLIALFANDKWNLKEDLSEMRGLRSLVESKVPLKYTMIPSGTTLLKKGEVVSEAQASMLDAVHKAYTTQKNSFRPESLLGSLILSGLLTLLAVVYLHHFHPHILSSSRKLTLFVFLILLTLVASKGLEALIHKYPEHLFESLRYPLLLPFSAILMAILFGLEIALFSSIFLTLLLGVGLSFDTLPFLIINTIGFLTVQLTVHFIRRRKQILKIGLKIWLAIFPALLAFQLYTDPFSSSLLYTMGANLILLLITVIAVLGILLFLETFFDIMTNFTLMEFMDPNHELLKKLSLEAPGTYQHCLVVGNLSEAAARAINANGLFCKVATLYHDIGKLINPNYFGENRQGEFDIHQLLTPQESAAVIIAHVAEGEALARKHKLPESFIDIIKEHHGTTLVSYFYHKSQTQLKENPDPQLFRYLGPKPHTKESAIIMIADGIEAASRSLEEVTEHTLSKLIDKLITVRMEDGQFDECQLTFEELGIIKKALLKTLLASCHLRIKYPEKQLQKKQIQPCIQNF